MFAVGRERGGQNAIRLALALVLVSLSSYLLPTITSAAEPVPVTQRRALYLAPTGGYQKLLAAINRNGGTILHSFPDAAVIATGDPTLLSTLVDSGLATYATEGNVPEEIVVGLDPVAELAVRAWQALLAGPSAISAHAEESYGPTGDALSPTDSDGLVGFALDPSLYQQSEFMTGKVAVNIVLLESNGALDVNLEDWTQEETQIVFQQVVAAMDWWQSLEPRAHLQFVYDDHYTAPVPISYEPIARPHNDERLWLSEAMQRLGFTHSSYLTAVRLYNRDSRMRYGADWAFTIFIVDSSNDGDNRFADNYFAYAYIYGPFMMLTYGNNGYGPTNMAAVIAHEMGHIFGALDEYAGANVPASAIGGYLGVPNGNSQLGGVIDVDCIMRGGLTPYRLHRLCPYTAGQVGWRDSDGDGILDPLDTTFTLDAAITANEAGILISGLAVENPYPSSTRTPITKNYVVSAQYRVNGSPWRALQAADGSFDSANEALTQQLPLAPRGGWQIEVMAIDTAGNTASKTIDYAVEVGDDPVVVTVVGSLASSVTGSQTSLSGTAIAPEGGSTILAIEYSLDAGDWQPVSASDGAFDSASESFTLTLTGLAPGSHNMLIRAWTTSPWVLAQPWEQIIDVQDSQQPDPNPDPHTPAVHSVFLPTVWGVPQ